MNKKSIVFIAGIVACALSAHVQKTFVATPATLQKVMKQVGAAAKGMKTDIVVTLHGGEYELSEPLTFGPNSSANNTHTITLRAAAGETPVISGGRQVTGWKRIHGNLWCAPLQSDHKLRSLFVNGKRCRMAGSRQLITGLGAYGEYDIKGTEPWAMGPGKAALGIKMPAGKEMMAFGNPVPSSWRDDSLLPVQLC